MATMITMGTIVATRRRVVLSDEFDARTVALPEAVGNAVGAND